MVFTTNKPLAAWAHVLHDPDLAEAILDRVLERGRLIELRGQSYRTRHLTKETAVERSHEPARVTGKSPPEYPEPTCVCRHGELGPVSLVPRRNRSVLGSR